MIDARPQRGRTTSSIAARTRRPANDRISSIAAPGQSPKTTIGKTGLGINPKAYACLTHPVAPPCGAALVPPKFSRTPEATECITSSQCQTPAIAPNTGTIANCHFPDTRLNLSNKGNRHHTLERPTSQPNLAAPTWQPKHSPRTAQRIG